MQQLLLQLENKTLEQSYIISLHPYTKEVIIYYLTITQLSKYKHCLMKNCGLGIIKWCCLIGLSLIHFQFSITNSPSKTSHSTVKEHMSVYLIQFLYIINFFHYYTYNLIFLKILQ